MRIATVLLALLVALPARAQETKKLDIAVLYAGVEGHRRTGLWMKFLLQRCRKAGTVALDKVTEEAARGYDVVIIDSPSPYAGKKFQFPRVSVPATFSRPLVLLGAAGGGVLNTRRIKLNWL